MRRFRGESGQSTTELALMMPVIFATFFWAFQVNIIMQGYHQVAYASFMAARGFEVQRNGRGDPQKIQQRILTGKIFMDNVNGPPSASATKRSDSAWGDADGATVNMPQFASLPYVRALLNFPSKVPTHLGANEYDMMHWSDMQHMDSGPKCNFTDNNIQDDNC